MANGEDTVDQRIVNALKKKEDLSKRVNKDDIKLLTGDFKKKDREALKDVEIDTDVAGEILPDEEGSPPPADGSDDSEDDFPAHVRTER